MAIDEERFLLAKGRAMGEGRERDGIGTLGEKTVHAVLKDYYAPEREMQEVRVAGFIADIYTGEEIIEVQTRSFSSMKRKLEAFLPICPVTIVYPIPRVKWLSWIDTESGERTPMRKSPKRGTPYQAFKELYGIRPFLPDPNLRLILALIDMEEYRLLNGWSRDKKKGSDRYDRIPVSFEQEVRVSCREDYAQFVPEGLAEPFTTRDFARAAGITVSLSRTALLILNDLGAVARVGKSGNSYLYRACGGSAGRPLMEEAIEERENVS